MGNGKGGGTSILNGDRSLISELLKVRLEGEIIVHRLNVGGQDLTALNIGRAGDLAASRAAHSAVGTIALRSLRERRARTTRWSRSRRRSRTRGG
jgi:hypothetical protein